MEKKFAWPDNNRVAIYFTAMLEVWSEGKAPTYGPQTTGLKPGVIDYGNISWSRYGGNVGAWRVLHFLENFGLKGSFAANSICTEIFPDLCKSVTAEGHEFLGHSVWQDEMLNYMDEAQQRATVHKSLDMFEKATGKRPVGWMSPVLASTPATADILTEAGIIWSADIKDIDLPKRVQTKSGPLVYVPVSDFTDNRVLRGSTRDYFDVCKDTFDYLYNHEPVSILHVVVHCHWGGRPPIMAQVYNLYNHFRQFPNVWFTTQTEVARWFLKEGLDEVPYKGRYASMRSA